MNKYKQQWRTPESSTVKKNNMTTSILEEVPEQKSNYSGLETQMPRALHPRPWILVSSKIVLDQKLKICLL